MKLNKIIFSVLIALIITLTGCKPSFDEITYRADLLEATEVARSSAVRLMGEIKTNGANCSNVNNDLVKSCSIKSNYVYLELQNFGETDLKISVRGNLDTFDIYCGVTPKKLISGIENDTCSSVNIHNRDRLYKLGYFN